MFSLSQAPRFIDGMRPRRDGRGLILNSKFSLTRFTVKLIRTYALIMILGHYER